MVRSLSPRSSRRLCSDTLAPSAHLHGFRITPPTLVFSAPGAALTRTIARGFVPELDSGMALLPSAGNIATAVITALVAGFIVENVIKGGAKAAADEAKAKQAHELAHRRAQERAARVVQLRAWHGQFMKQPETFGYGELLAFVRYLRADGLSSEADSVERYAVQRAAECERRLRQPQQTPRPSNALAAMHHASEALRRQTFAFHYCNAQSQGRFAAGIPVLQRV